MPELRRADGTRIHYEVAGDEGPSLILASYWSWTPGVYEEMLADLAADHRVATYHLRGSGESSRRGPYDMETDIGDLEAVVEAVGAPAVLISTADGSNRAARLAARRPDLVSAVISFGTAPLAREAFEGKEGMIASTTVIGAFGEMLESNYRSAMRVLMEATNPQATEAELRDRVDAQARFHPGEAAAARFRNWVGDDPRPEARAIGERLWIFSAAAAAGSWLPASEELERMTREGLPEAKVVKFEANAGPISRPHESADAVRQISAPLRGLAERRK